MTELLEQPKPTKPLLGKGAILRVDDAAAQSPPASYDEAVARNTWEPSPRRDHGLSEEIAERMPAAHGEDALWEKLANHIRDNDADLASDFMTDDDGKLFEAAKALREELRKL